MVWLILVVVAYLAATTVLWTIYGRNVAIVFATAGIVYIIFTFGKYFGKKKYIEKAEHIETKRQEKYDEIDNRKLDHNDVIERLRNKSY